VTITRKKDIRRRSIDDSILISDQRDQGKEDSSRVVIGDRWRITRIVRKKRGGYAAQKKKGKWTK
jgi:predicted pyridoxine 5'-phosphate oxidase superfamily flavin-nucleotide-binding protein